MGERRLVHELFHSHTATGGSASDEQLRRLVAHRDRVAALLRAGRRPDPAAGPWRSSYAARLWALAEASEPVEAAAGPSAHLTLVEPDDDERW